MWKLLLVSLYAFLPLSSGDLGWNPAHYRLLTSSETIADILSLITVDLDLLASSSGTTVSLPLQSGDILFLKFEDFAVCDNFVLDNLDYTSSSSIDGTLNQVTAEFTMQMSFSCISNNGSSVLHFTSGAEAGTEENVTLTISAEFNLDAKLLFKTLQSTAGALAPYEVDLLHTEGDLCNIVSEGGVLQSESGTPMPAIVSADLVSIQESLANRLCAEIINRMVSATELISSTSVVQDIGIFIVPNNVILVQPDEIISVLNASELLIASELSLSKNTFQLFDSSELEDLVNIYFGGFIAAPLISQLIQKGTALVLGFQSGQLTNDEIVASIKDFASFIIGSDINLADSTVLLIFNIVFPLVDPVLTGDKPFSDLFIELLNTGLAFVLSQEVANALLAGEITYGQAIISILPESILSLLDASGLDKTLARLIDQLIDLILNFGARRLLTVSDPEGDYARDTNIQTRSLEAISLFNATLGDIIALLPESTPIQIISYLESFGVSNVFISVVPDILGSLGGLFQLASSIFTSSELDIDVSTPLPEDIILLLQNLSVFVPELVPFGELLASNGGYLAAIADQFPVLDMDLSILNVGVIVKFDNFLLQPNITFDLNGAGIIGNSSLLTPLVGFKGTYFEVGLNFSITSLEDNSTVVEDSVSIGVVFDFLYQLGVVGVIDFTSLQLFNFDQLVDFVNSGPTFLTNFAECALSSVGAYITTEVLNVSVASDVFFNGDDFSGEVESIVSQIVELYTPGLSAFIFNILLNLTDSVSGQLISLRSLEGSCGISLVTPSPTSAPTATAVSTAQGLFGDISSALVFSIVGVVFIVLLATIIYILVRHEYEPEPQAEAIKNPAEEKDQDLTSVKEISPL